MLRHIIQADRPEQGAQIETFASKYPVGRLDEQCMVAMLLPLRANAEGAAEKGMRLNHLCPTYLLLPHTFIPESAGWIPKEKIGQAAIKKKNRGLSPIRAIPADARKRERLESVNVF